MKKFILKNQKKLYQFFKEKNYFLFSIFLLFYVQNISAQFTSIPDSNFEQRLFDLGIDSVNGDNQVLTNSVSSVTSLDVSAKSISNLTGIEAFVSLQYLTCNNNLLTSLNTSTLSQLTTLKANDNAIATLDLSNASSLINVDVSYNEMNSLNVAGLTALEILNCTHNNLANLSVNTLSSLLELDCSFNQITNLSVVNLTSLSKLYIDNNLISTIELYGLTSVFDLICSGNQIAALNIETLTSLNRLDCNNNQLTSLNVSNASQLEELYCYSNLLTNLNINFLPLLRVLNCDSNQLPGLSFNGTNNIENFVVSNNLISYIDVAGMDSLHEFICMNNLLTNLNLSNLPNLNIADCSNNLLTSFIATNLPILTNLNCSNNQLSSLNISNLPAMIALLCNNNQISFLDVSPFGELVNLVCHNNILNNLNVFNLNNLTTLQCDFNQLTTINLTGVTNLQDLKCDHNSLTSLDLSLITNLTDLDCTINPNLSCIKVLNPVAAYANTSYSKDPATIYSTDCIVSTNPTLSSISQTGVSCSTDFQYFELTGLQPNSTSTIEYTVNGIQQPNFTNVQASSNGYATMYIIIPASSSGQTLTVTKVTRTDISGTTPLVTNLSTTVQSNPTVTYYQDSDGDGKGNPNEPYTSCDGVPLNYSANNTDCDDSNPDPFFNFFSVPNPTVCSNSEPVLVSISSNTRPVSGTFGGCLNANYGEYPSSDYTPSNYDGITPNIIVTNGYAGEYSVVNIIPNTKYIFKSEKFYNSFYGANSQNDRVTIGTLDGLTVLASGQHTAVWQSTVATQVRFYSHANYQTSNQEYIGPCGTESFSRTRSIICFPTNYVQPVVWSPTTGLFTDAAGTIPYTGTSATSLYVKPTQYTEYTVTAPNGCTNSNPLIGNFNPNGALYYADNDGDGYGNPQVTQLSCTPIPGYTLTPFDCDDTNASITVPVTNNTIITACNSYTWPYNNQTYTESGIYFGANTSCLIESLNLTITPTNLTFFSDNDGDGFGNPSVSIIACEPLAGYVVNNLDCDDTNATITVGTSYFQDADGDGFGNNTTSLISCSQPIGYVINNTDCDDTNPLQYNSSLLYADFDDDGFTTTSEVICYDAQIPSGYKTEANGFDCNDFDPNKYYEQVLFIDNDNDGYDNGTELVCRGNVVPSGYSVATNGIDCNDSNININSQISLFIDNDNDGFDNGTIMGCPDLVNQGGFTLTTQGLDCDDNNDQIQQQMDNYFQDADGDGFGNALISLTECNQPSGYVTNFFDCDDNNPTLFQGVALYIDFDNDGYSSNENYIIGCAGEPVPTGFVLNPLGLDCDDTNPTIGIVNHTFYNDADNDGFGNPNLESTGGCIAPYGFVENNLDCDDTRVNVHPGAIELAYDGLDNNCNGTIDEGFPPLQTNLNAAVCGTTLPFIYSSVATPYVPVSGITGYRFKAKNMTTLAEQIIDRGLFNWFRLNQLPVYDFATTYEVSVELQRNGVWLGYYGDPCSITTPGVPVINQCGQTIAAGGALTTTALTGVTQYTFQVTNIAAATTQTFNKPSNILIVNQIPGYLATTAYSVSVAIKTAGGALSLFGEACTINPAPATRFGTSVVTTTGTEFKAVGAPNPFESNFTLSVTTVSDEKVQIAVYDMIGKQLESKEVTAEQANALEVGVNYPSGVYNVIVSQGVNAKSLRIIKR